MNLAIALGAGAVGAVLGCALRDEKEEEKSDLMGCKCRAKMDSTFEMEGHELGCPYHDALREEEDQLYGRARPQGARLPGARPFSSGMFMGLARRPVGTNPYLSGDQPVPPGYNCQATQEGGVICSDGTGFPPGCPKCPTTNYPGVAEKKVVGSQIIDVPPPWPSAGGDVAGIPVVPLAIGAGVLALILFA